MEFAVKRILCLTLAAVLGLTMINVAPASAHAPKTSSALTTTKHKHHGHHHKMAGAAVRHHHAK